MYVGVRCDNVMGIGGGKIQSSSWLIDGGKDTTKKTKKNCINM